jgi:adenosylcobinamide-phosphate synthase
MRFELQVVCALALDFVAGDPQWMPHPVRLIGRLAVRLEAPTRRLLPPRRAGIVTAILTIGATGFVTWALLGVAGRLHPVAGDLVAVLLLWTTLAARDLADHATDVGRALGSGNLSAARRCLGKMVGRDTVWLDEPEVVRATVESVAENTTDGVTAPLFYACLFGPVGAMVHKAINTLDSTFGYKNERYLLFGWASARVDDVAGFVPARLTAPLIALGAALAGLRPSGAVRVLLRDGRHHPSPNSGLAEAAVAGALGVQLGGMNYYAGRPSPKPTLGEAHVALTRAHIGQAIRLMIITSLLAAAAFLALRLLVFSSL